jgi:hypothetical protein
MYFIYNIFKERKLVKADEYEEALKSGIWFKSPFEAFVAKETALKEKEKKIKKAKSESNDNSTSQ